MVPLVWLLNFNLQTGIFQACKPCNLVNLTLFNCKILHNYQFIFINNQFFLHFFYLLKPLLDPYFIGIIDFYYSNLLL